MSKCMLSILALLFANLIAFCPFTTVFADEKAQAERTEIVDIDPKVLANIYPQETTIALPPNAVARFGRGGGSDVAVSPDGTLVAVVSNIGVWLYSVYTDEFLSLLASKGENIPSTAAFSPDGTRIAVGMSGRQPTVQIWDIATRKPIATFIGHKRGIQSLAFSPNSRLLASGGSDGVTYLWDVTSYR